MYGNLQWISVFNCQNATFLFLPSILCRLFYNMFRPPLPSSGVVILTTIACGKRCYFQQKSIKCWYMLIASSTHCHLCIKSVICNNCTVLIFWAGMHFIKKGKVIPITGRGGPYGCETSRLPHFLDNRLTDGGKFIGLTRQEIPVTGCGGPQG
jgi:hypothetical protein